MVEADGQVVLGDADDRCKEGASRIAQLAHDAARENGFSFGVVGGMIGKDKVAASRAFDREDPAVVLRCLAGAILLDKQRIIVHGICGLVGMTAVERPRLTKEQKYDLLMETLRRHGRVGEGFIAEAFGEDAP